MSKYLGAIRTSYDSTKWELTNNALVLGKDKDPIFCQSLEELIIALEEHHPAPHPDLTHVINEYDTAIVCTEPVVRETNPSLEKLAELSQKYGQLFVELTIVNRDELTKHNLIRVKTFAPSSYMFAIKYAPKTIAKRKKKRERLERANQEDLEQRAKQAEIDEKTHKEEIARKTVKATHIIHYATYNLAQNEEAYNNYIKELTDSNTPPMDRATYDFIETACKAKHLKIVYATLNTTLAKQSAQDIVNIVNSIEESSRVPYQMIFTYCDEHNRLLIATYTRGYIYIE